MKYIVYIFVYSAFAFGSSTILYEGDSCEIDDESGNISGKCLNISDCPFAKQLLKVNKIPQHCGFQRMIPIVCCPVKNNSSLNENTQSTKNPASGDKSIKKCSEYNSKDLDDGLAGFGGTNAEPQEYAHMAVLGYGPPDAIQWQCGGSLISEIFILTAAHCINSQNLGQVTTVRLGELDINSSTDDAKPEDYKIAEIFIHPSFKPPSHYNDIALLKLDGKPNFSVYTRPACLYPKYDVNFSTFEVTGWGKTDFFGDASSHLIKVTVDYIDYKTCAKSYANVLPNKLKNGINDETQICAGGADGRDSCPGDSGGPLQITSAYRQLANETKPHFYIVGITSFGKACGVENSVGVYTRVAPYVGWIENIVWL